MVSVVSSFAHIVKEYVKSKNTERLAQTGYWSRNLIKSDSFEGQAIDDVKSGQKIPRDIFVLRTVPTIVIAHTFCASRDTRISYR